MPADPEDLPPLDAKPPEFLQNLKWLKEHGWRYKWLLAVVCVLGIPLALPQVRGYWGEITRLFQRKAPQIPEGSLPTKSLAQDKRSSDPAEKRFLTTDETPDRIFQALAGHSDSERERRFQTIYAGFWLSHPWSGKVLSLPIKFGDGSWSVTLDVETSSTNRTGFELGRFLTTQDASQLRPGVRIAVTGQVAVLTSQAVVLRDGSFRLAPE